MSRDIRSSNIVITSCMYGKQKLIEYSQNMILPFLVVCKYLFTSPSFNFDKYIKTVKRLQCENERFSIISKHICSACFIAHMMGKKYL